MNTVLAIADIKDGVMSILYREKFAESVKCLVDGRYSLELKKIFNQRSIKQNRAKWGIPYRILQQCFTEASGEYVTVDWVHEFCKEHFLPAEYVERLKEKYKNDPLNHIVSEKTGEIIDIPFRLTTTEMTTVEEKQYYQNMQRFGAEFFWVDIPDPDPKYKQLKQLKNEE